MSDSPTRKRRDTGAKGRNPSGTKLGFVVGGASVTRSARPAPGVGSHGAIPAIPSSHDPLAALQPDDEIVIPVTIGIRDPENRDRVGKRRQDRGVHREGSCAS